MFSRPTPTVSSISIKCIHLVEFTKITVLFQFVEIYVNMNCIILNSVPIMCFKGAPMLATFLCLNGSLLDQLSCIIFTCCTCTYSDMYTFLSVCMSVHLREVGGLICHSSPYIL